MPLFILKKAFIVKTLFALEVKKRKDIQRINKNTAVRVNKAVSLIFERQRFKMLKGLSIKDIQLKKRYN